MAEIKPAVLFGKLNSVAYKALEGATVFCKMRGNPQVELVHWIFQLVQAPDTDLLRIIKHFGIDASKLASDLQASLDRLPRGASGISGFSQQLQEAVEKGFVFGQLLFGELQVRTGHIVVALLKDPGLRHILPALAKEFGKIKEGTLSDDFEKIVAGSAEEALSPADGSGAAGNAPGDASGAIAPAALGKQEALKRFTTD
ncbi:MAG: Clp protease N-terminal domain-containing protein, partial [Chthoniobacteraceae bacterium]